MKKYNNKMMMNSLGLPDFDDIASLAEATRLTNRLLYFLTDESATERYKVFYIPKKDGTAREINAPCLSLKLLQRWVLENVLYKVAVSPYCIGFRKSSEGSPLVKCAERHKNNLFILKMDLKNFFPSINRERVFKLFMKIGYNTYAANLLANICTLDGKLPQGAVTSPYISNIICYRMDARIAGYCNKRDIAYTRYADDLIFSCDNKQALEGIYGTISKIIIDEGFSVNTKKTVFLTPIIHKEIVGITVNDGKIKAPKEIKRMIRAMIHYEIMTGDYSSNDKIKGYVAYVNSIEKNYKDKTIKYINKYANSTMTLFMDLVEKFNANKLYKEVNDIRVKTAADFVKEKDESDFYEMVFEERRDYLSRHGLADELE